MILLLVYINEEEEEKSRLRAITFYSILVTSNAVIFLAGVSLTSFFLSLSPYTVVDDDENDVR